MSASAPADHGGGPEQERSPAPAGASGTRPKPAESARDIDRMLLALEESRKALPACLPNPPVGCVLVRSGGVVASGYTHDPGGFHAEAHALSVLAGTLEDVQAYVTLEPCSFQGRTPSCALELVKRRVGAVFVALVDPHPRNRGKGIEILRQAGISVVVGIAEREVTRFIGPHLHRRRHLR